MEEELPFTPCIGVCRLDEQGLYCVGCLRTVDEIARWYGLSDEEKRHIYAQLEERKARRRRGCVR